VPFFESNTPFKKSKGSNLETLISPRAGERRQEKTQAGGIYLLFPRIDRKLIPVPHAEVKRTKSSKLSPKSEILESLKGK